MNSSRSNLFLGISTGTCNFCGDQRSLLGRSPSFPPCEAHIDPHGSQAVKARASRDRDKIIELFNRIGNFFGRLEAYTGIIPTTAMRGLIIEIMVEVLMILAIVTKEMKSGRFSELQ